jgi:hypothetical protein
VRDFIKRCKKKAVANVLGYPDKKAPMRYINRLLASIGVKLVAQQIERVLSASGLTDIRPDAATKLTSKGAQRICSLLKIGMFWLSLQPFVSPKKWKI